MITPVLKMTYGSRPIEVLNQLIEKRKEILKESTRDAVVATAITVLKSLRADTKTAPGEAPEAAVRVEDTGLTASWERKGTTHRVVRTGPRGSVRRDLFPVNLAGHRYMPGENVRVYRVTPAFPDRMTWEKNKHKGCWYVFAQSEDVARNFGLRAVTRRIAKYRGLAHTALGFAMAKTSTRQQFTAKSTSAKAQAAANAATNVVEVSGDGTWVISVTDALDYAGLALKSGPSGVNRAMMKGANSIAGRLRHSAAAPLDPPISTPFPEVSK